jgi:hypothetical protein
MMGDSHTSNSVTSFINSAFELSENEVRFCEGDSENAAFIRMIKSVRHDLAETERLLEVESVKARLISTPGKLPYIRGVIINTQTALKEIGRLVERERVNCDKTTNVPRVRWIFNDDGKLVSQRSEISTCHQALSTVLAFLTPLEKLSTVDQAKPPDYHDATFFDDFISPWQRRKLQREAIRSSSLDIKREGNLFFFFFFFFGRPLRSY